MPLRAPGANQDSMAHEQRMFSLVWYVGWGRAEPVCISPATTSFSIFFFFFLLAQISLGEIELIIILSLYYMKLLTGYD